LFTSSVFTRGDSTSAKLREQVTNFLYVGRVFSSSGLLMRPHHVRMGDQLLSQLVFLTCNKHLEFDWT